VRSYLRPCLVILCGVCIHDAGRAQPAETRPTPASAPSLQDGSHDFDFEVGVWKTQLSRRLRPLTGSSEWVEYAGTTTVRSVWGGAGNLVELDVSGPAGRLEGLSLRLYNPATRQWSLNFSNRAAGEMAVPAVGSFNKGRGEFYNSETLNGRAILVRFVIFDITPTSCRFEQAFSADGGKTWEVNWIASDTLLSRESRPALPPR
jgi:hypothetical protein